MKIFESARDKTSKMACAPSKDSDQPGHHAQSSLCTQWVAKDSGFLSADSKDSDLTGHMPSLIWVFTDRTSLIVGFVVCWLTYLDIPITDNYVVIILYAESKGASKPAQSNQPSLF